MNHNAHVYLTHDVAEQEAAAYLAIALKSESEFWYSVANNWEMLRCECDAALYQDEQRD